MALALCSIASGSSGNCYVIASKSTKVLVDAGISGKKIRESLESIQLSPYDIDGILITHEHIDHVKGAGIFSRKYDTPIYANEKTWESMGCIIGKVEEHNRRILRTTETFSINDLKIKSFNIPHDAVEPIGYSFYKEDVQLSVATDIGYMTEEVFCEICKADFLVLESNHDVEMLKVGKYPWNVKKRILGEKGHLSNIDAGKILINILKSQKKRPEVLLAHLSHENNFPQMAHQTIKNILEEEEYYIGKDINLYIALREGISEIYKIRKKELCTNG
ncbi:MAG: MBL fold metallo-hydrolase [Peptostreptococcales bacterium]